MLLASAEPVIDADLLRARASILRAMRRWFDDRGYLEVHTPALVPSAAMEQNLEAVSAADGFLHTSPEFAMKRVLAAGLSRIYQIAPCFRGDESGRHHHREFTLLEWYRAGAGTPELMDEVVSLIAACADAIGAPAPAFERRAVSSLLADNRDHDAWFRAWVETVEPTLTEPTIVYDYPAWQAALARVRGGLADRFEVFLGGLELANAFDEELDPAEILRRWQAGNAARSQAGRPAHPIDHGFLDAVGRMPRCAGIALGVDRLVMALTNTDDIARVQVRVHG
jgi:lysyl-tRNA synthetase class 2